jgi:hypothetical protein
MRNATIYTLTKTVVPVYDNDKYVRYAPLLDPDELFRIPTDDPDNKVLFTRKNHVESLPLHEVGFCSSLPLRDLPEVERLYLESYDGGRKSRNYDPSYLHLFAIEPQTEKILSTYINPKLRNKVVKLENTVQDQGQKLWALERNLEESQNDARVLANSIRVAEERVERFRREPLLKRLWIALRLRRDGSNCATLMPHF